MVAAVIGFGYQSVVEKGSQQGALTWVLVSSTVVYGTIWLVGMMIASMIKVQWSFSIAFSRFAPKTYHHLTHASDRSPSEPSVGVRSRNNNKQTFWDCRTVCSFVLHSSPPHPMSERPSARRREESAENTAGAHSIVTKKRPVISFYIFFSSPRTFVLALLFCSSWEFATTTVFFQSANLSLCFSCQDQSIFPKVAQEDFQWSRSSSPKTRYLPEESRHHETNNAVSGGSLVVSKWISRMNNAATMTRFSQSL